jgi:hypothetical protein
VTSTDTPFPYDPDQTGQECNTLDDADAAANIEASEQEQSTHALPSPESSLMMSCPATAATPSAPGISARSTCT